MVPLLTQSSWRRALHITPAQDHFKSFGVVGLAFKIWNFIP